MSEIILLTFALFGGFMFVSIAAFIYFTDEETVEEKHNMFMAMTGLLAVCAFSALVILKTTGQGIYQ